MNPSDVLTEAKKIYFQLPFIEFLWKAAGISGNDLKTMFDELKNLIISSKESNPYVLLFTVIQKSEENWTAKAPMPVHGGWNHILVPGVVLAAMRNSGHPITDADILEGIQRGDMGKVSCGFSGTCGGATGFGIVAAVVKRSTPLHDQERQENMMLVVNTQQEIAKIARRCCKRSTYIGIKHAVNHMAQLGYDLLTMTFKCPYSVKNNMCAREKCPYFAPH